MELEIIKHKDILFRDLLRAIAVKTVAWPFPLESQVKWINENLDDADLHVILKDGYSDVAYLNLVQSTFIVNDTEYMAYGIGNVCSREKGKGYGGELMNQVNAYLVKNRHAGLLFCKDTLVSFYSRYGWEEVSRDKCDIPALPEGSHVMTNLVPERADKLIYHGKLF